MVEFASNDFVNFGIHMLYDCSAAQCCRLTQAFIIHSKCQIQKYTIAGVQNYFARILSLIPEICFLFCLFYVYCHYFVIYYLKIVLFTIYFYSNNIFVVYNFYAVDKFCPFFLFSLHIFSFCIPFGQQFWNNTFYISSKYSSVRSYTNIVFYIKNIFV